MFSKIRILPPIITKKKRGRFNEEDERRTADVYHREEREMTHTIIMASFSSPNEILA